jgi:hypothetical protein
LHFQGKKEKSNDINRLLNRMLAVEVDMQGQIFGFFTAIMDEVRTMQ